MLRPWRRIAVATFAGTAAIAAQLTLIAPAQAAAPTITVAATSKIAPVTGDVMVVYLGGAYSSATIHGTIAGAAAGEVAVLYGQQFPYKKPPVRLGAVTLHSSTLAYSFRVTPDLATHYAVKLFTSASARIPAATSRVQNVYVLANGKVTGGKSCQRDRPVCHETYHLYIIVPPSALSTEMGKHTYPYVGLNLAPTSAPPPPKWLYLNAYHASVTTARKTNTDEFVNVLTFRLPIGNDGYYFNWLTCARDTVRADGLGLPGSHGCGYLHRVSGTHFSYLG
jgi:hypothetical protein